MKKNILLTAMLCLGIGYGGLMPIEASAQSNPGSKTANPKSTTPSVIKADPIVSGIEWLSLEEAYARNQQEPRKIFVDVYTDWCGWCKKMDKSTFADDKVAEYVNENYYAVKLNAESDREFQMAGEKMTERGVARQLGVRSYPTIILIHEDFQKFQPAPGYRPAGDFLEILQKFQEINIQN